MKKENNLPNYQSPHLVEFIGMSLRHGPFRDKNMRLPDFEVFVDPKNGRVETRFYGAFQRILVPTTEEIEVLTRGADTSLTRRNLEERIESLRGNKRKNFDGIFYDVHVSGNSDGSVISAGFNIPRGKAGKISTLLPEYLWNVMMYSGLRVVFKSPVRTSRVYWQDFSSTETLEPFLIYRR